MTIAPARHATRAALTLAITVWAAVAAQAQALPGGSYERSCKQIHWAGTTLVAECKTADGRYTGTGLPNANKCVGDVGNNDGRLQCNYAGGGQSPGASSTPRGQQNNDQQNGNRSWQNNNNNQSGYGGNQQGYGGNQQGYGGGYGERQGYGGNGSGPGYGNGSPGYGYGSPPPAYPSPGYPAIPGAGPYGGGGYR